MTVCAKPLSSLYEECWFVEPVTISQPAANPATFLLLVEENKARFVS